ncbi:MAG: SIR2 family protein [Thermodesulfovibrionia bacterium]|nr:SIR2 family protein [Thermodesulfovibrionia bacterium]
MQKEISRNILFTGAGFTKNFGGLLAKEMWSKIFNNVQAYPRLRELLFHETDYESIYYHVMTGDYEDEEKNAIDVAIFEAYRILDDIVRAWTFRDGAPNPVNIYGVNKLIERFCGSRDEIGFFFTLNQDIFIERHFNSLSKMLIHPGVPRIPDTHKIINRLPLERQDFITVPTNEQLRNKPINSISSRTLHYVKLHGSFGWLSSDGTNCYVIGKKKENQIADEPLLSWYFDLFTQVLSKPDRKLFVIGYGFKDRHVNEVIASSINNSNLKLYVMSPSAQSEFLTNVGAVEHGETILKGLSGYFPYTLLEVFTSDQSESHGWREIVKWYFTN